MIRLISMEFIKYKRYHILWLGIASILFSILLAAFQLAGTNNSIISNTGLSEGVIWNHFSLFLYVYADCRLFHQPRIYRSYTQKHTGHSSLKIFADLVKNRGWFWPSHNGSTVQLSGHAAYGDNSALPGC